MTLPTDAPNLADPLNWPTPEPQFAAGQRYCGPRCRNGYGCYSLGRIDDPRTYSDDAMRAYIRHYYREHMYRNWSA